MGSLYEISSHPKYWDDIEFSWSPKIVWKDRPLQNNTAYQDNKNALQPQVFIRLRKSDFSEKIF